MNNFDERQLKEIAWGLVYSKYFNHGTAGHNQLLLIARLALELGFTIEDGLLYRNGVQMYPPVPVKETNDESTRA